MQTGNLVVVEQCQEPAISELGKVSSLLYYVRRHEVSLVRLTVPVAVGHDSHRVRRR